MQRLPECFKKNSTIIVTIIFYIVIPYAFYNNLIGNDGIWGAGDGIIQYIPHFDYFAKSIRTLNLNFWNDKIFLGVPFVESLSVSYFYPLNWLFGLFKMEDIYNVFIMLHFSIAGIFTYMYLREIGLSKKASFVAGLVYMFSGSISGRRNHVNILYTIAWFPLIMYLYEKMINRGTKKYVILAAIAFLIPIYTGGMQHYLYISITILIYAILSLNRFTNIKQWVFNNLNFLIISISLSLPVVYFMYSASAGTTKNVIDYNFFSSYSLEFKSLITFIAPYIFGTHIPNNPNILYKIGYFGPGNLSEFGLYIGIFPFIIAIITSYNYFTKDKYVRIWTAIAVISVVLSLGASIPLLNKIMYHVPIYNLFRVPARWLFITDFSLVVIFGYFIDKAVSNNSIFRIFVKPYILFSLFFVFVLSMLCVITANILKNIDLSNYPKQHNMFISFNFSNPAIYIPIILICLYICIFIVYTFVDFKKYNVGKILYSFLTLVLLIDLGTFSYYHENVTVSIGSNVLAQHIKEINTGNSRVWPILSDEIMFDGIGPNTNMMNDISTLNGYWGMLPQNMSTILGFDQRGYNQNYFNLINDYDMLSSLNTKYIITKNDSQYNFVYEIKDSIKEDTTLLNVNDIKLNRGVENSLDISEFPVKIESNKFYKIEIEIEGYDIPDKDEWLMIDLYGGPQYDNSAQEIDINYKTKVKRIERIIYSGNVPDTNIAFRVFKFTKTPLNIKSIKLSSIEYEGNPVYEVAYKNDKYIIFNNINSLDKIYSVDKVNTLDSIYSLGSENLLKTAYIEGSSLGEKYYTKTLIDIIAYKNGYIKANVNAKEAGFVVFSQSYNKGWKAYLNGKRINAYRVNGLIQGVEIPNGEYTLEFKYFPDSIIIALIIYLIAITYIAIYVKKMR